MPNTSPKTPALDVPPPFCLCFGDQPRNLLIHTETQDTACAGWQRLNALIEEAARDGRTTFSPRSELSPQEWAQIMTLPASIATLKAVKHLILYGSHLVRIPPEIGELESLEEFTPYTSYKLHWFPYEILRCKNLKESTISTRALYGNYKYRPPFPRLPQLHPTIVPQTCSVCRGPLDSATVHQAWLSLRVATDVVPLLVHACSEECITHLPTPPENYVQTPHLRSDSSSRRAKATTTVPLPRIGGAPIFDPITEFETLLTDFNNYKQKTEHIPLYPPFRGPWVSPWGASLFWMSCAAKRSFPFQSSIETMRWLAAGPRYSRQPFP